MKKISILIIVMVMAVSISGCGKQNNGTYNYNTEDNVIVIGCDDYSPFSYADSNGEMTGIDVELAKEAFSRIGYTPEFVFINWENKKQLLADGDIDCVWSSFTMTDREDEYKWAGPYMKSNQVIAVNIDSDIQTFADLEGKVIAVQNTTKPEDIIRSHNGTLPEFRKVISVQKRDLIFILLSKGYADALAAHATSVEQFTNDTGLEFRMLEEPLQSVDLGVAFDINDTRGINVELTNIIEQMKEDGTIERILSEYLSDVEMYLED